MGQLIYIKLTKKIFFNPNWNSGKKKNIKFQVGIFPGRKGKFNVAKTINIHNRIHDIKEKNKVIISIDAEIIIDKD